jgi:hypothetical protein
MILDDADCLEALRVLLTAKPCGESWKTVVAVSTFCLDYFVVSAPGIDYGPRIASFIDSLADWPIMDYPLEVAAASRERCHCCCAEVEDGCLLFDCEPGFGFRPRAPP